MLGQGSPAHPFTSGRQQGRLNRDGIDQFCEAPKPHPGIFSREGARLYDAYAFANLTSAPACSTVRITPRGGPASGVLFSAAYLSRFDPADPAVNWLADPGLSSGLDTTRTFSFVVPAGAQVIIVVHEVNAGAYAGVPYTLQVEGLSRPEQLLLQDPRSPAHMLLISPTTGQFLAVCGEAVSGTGTVRTRGTVLTFRSSASGSRIFAVVDLARRRGVVSILGRMRCSFLDPNIDDNDPTAGR